jgi:predicted nuclease with TOPRIM domain
MTEENTIPAAISALVTLLITWIGFRRSSQDTNTKFQESLLSRIESLEVDNESLRKKNEELLSDNLAERQKQMDLEQKIQQMEHEKLRMLDRIQDLEEKVKALLESSKNIN